MYTSTRWGLVILGGVKVAWHWPHAEPRSIQLIRPPLQLYDLQRAKLPLFNPTNLVERAKQRKSFNMSSQPQFIHYPEVREGPLVPYKNEDQSIPVFRGLPLAIGATL
jgi:hypothetical protein